MNYAQIHPQSQSKLLSAPAEIRRAIYANLDIDYQVHIFLKLGKICQSVCLQPNMGDDHHDGRERQTFGEGSSETQWARRLRSSWGPHWQCEEVAFSENMDSHERGCNQVCKLLLVCKKMFLDVCDFMSDVTTISITDLDTLDLFLSKSHGLNNVSKHSWNLWNYTSPRIQNLNITLRLPLAFYKALEEDETLPPETSHHMSTVSKACTKWLRLWPAVCQLQHLRNLYIWLDHDGPTSWSFVNERLALHHAISTLAVHTKTRSRVLNQPEIHIAFNLPKLHPRVARPETHFVQGSASPPCIIERRFRQRHHCEEGPSGDLRVKYKSDFPVMHEIPAFIEESRRERFPDAVEEPSMTYEELEKLERGLWEGGTDVYRLMMEMSGHMCFPQNWTYEI